MESPNTHTVPYEVEYKRMCITVCPYITADEEPTYVGSAKCSLCVCHLSKDRESKTVKCRFSKNHEPVYRQKKMTDPKRRYNG